MNNEELKKKIVEIFDKAIGDWYEKDDGLFAEGYTPEEGDNRFKGFIADALIAAGIGDVKETEAEANRYEMLYLMQSRDMALAERKAYESEHHAARAERALRVLARKFVIFAFPNGDWKELIEQLVSETKAQAEKELAEEEKDD